MYGFVYIWRDKKHNRYYIGCHWGCENDKYVCSSSWMKRSYKRRPQDFKRRILEKIHTTRDDMFLAEERWLKLIKTDELGKKYYNLKKGKTGGWGGNRHSEETKQKLAAINRGKKHSPETIQKLKLMQIGRKFSEEHRAKLSQARKGKPMPLATRQKISSTLLNKTG